LLAGESGVSTLDYDWVQTYDLPVTFAGQAKVRPETVLERQEFKRLDPSAQLALISAREAWADAGSPDVAPERILVDYATGIGGLWTLLDGWDTLREKGPRRVFANDDPDADAQCCRCGGQHGSWRTGRSQDRRLCVCFWHRVNR
jgi:3-oxoacyl-[acyl-carrier-protein] synthase II